MKPVFDENGLATVPGDMRCFYYDAETSEYTGWSDEYINTGVGNDSNLLIVFYVQIMPDDFVMQLHRF